MKYKLYIAERQDFSIGVFNFLKQRFDIVEFEGHISLIEILKNVDVFWFRLGYKLNKDVLVSSIRCRYLVTPVTGIDHIDEELCRQIGITIICLRGETEFLKKIRATAELTIALTLSLMRNLHSAISDVKSGVWDRDRFRGYELYEKKVGVIGMGRLGAIVAHYFESFGCNVSYYDPFVNRNDILKVQDLFELIEHADIISIHVNYNEDNHHFFNRQCFDKMKRNAILINSSRGGLIDESALLTALETRSIRGAALDVIEGEPNISLNKLVNYSKYNSNLIISPHIGGNTFESFEKTEEFIAKKLVKIINGQPK